jgi:hypothetical protein
MKTNNLLRLVVVFSFCQIATIFSVLSQDLAKPISFGIKVGASSSGFTRDRQVFSDKKLGLACGIFAEYKLMGFLGVEVSANYVQEGGAHVSPKLVYPVSLLNVNQLVTKQSSDVLLHTLQVPLILNIRPSVMSENLCPRISVGYSFDFILNATSKDNVMMTSSPNNILISDRHKENVTSSFSAMNMGPILGLGLDFKSDKHIYLLDVKYKIGMSEINNLGSLTTTNGERPFSISTLTITIGIVY